MGVKVTGQFEPAGDFSIVDGKDVSGNITGSNISASGTITANAFSGDGSGLTGVVSGADISGSWQGHLSSSKVTFGGDIVAAGDITAQNFIVSSSVTDITYQSLSGSTIFGDSIDDTHKVTGSMIITGSLGVNRTATGRGDVEIAGHYHEWSAGNGQLALLSNVSASNASGSDQGGQIVFGGPISDSDLTRTFGLIAGLKENSTENNRAGYLAFGTRRGDGDRDIHEHIKITSTGDLLFGVTNDGNKISGSATSTGSFGLVRAADDVAGKRIVAYSNYGGAGFETSLKDNQLLFGYNGDEDAYGVFVMGSTSIDIKTNTGANPLLRLDKNTGDIIVWNGNVSASGDFLGSSTSTGSFGSVHTSTLFGATGGRVATMAGGQMVVRDHFSVASGKGIFLDGGSDTFIIHSTSNQIDFAVANSVKMEISTTAANFGQANYKISGSATSTGSFGHGFIDGKLGINTTAPVDRFHVVGVVRAQDGSSANDYVKMFHDGTDGKFTSNRGKLKLEAQSSAHMVELVSAGISGSATSTGSFGVYSNNFIPSIDNTHDLGSSTHRWANAHIGDIELSNEGTEGNEVDGTTGSWTIQEGEDDLYLLNRKNGKKYKFKLEEIK